MSGLAGRVEKSDASGFYCIGCVVLSDAFAALREDASRPVLERHASGKFVELRARGLPVLVFEIGDRVARDVAIASLIRLKMHDEEIRALCGVSHGWVCKVRARLRAGGIGEVVRVRAKGRPPTIVGARQRQLLRLSAMGKSQRTIARELGVAPSAVARALAALKLRRAEQLDLKSADTVLESSLAPVAACEPPTVLPVADVESPWVKESLRDATPSDCDLGEATPRDNELAAGEPLPSGPAEHPTRYAGVLLVAGALASIGFQKALAASRVARPKAAVYDAMTALFAMMASWSIGFPSLESMHERDARALGVVLGLERSPSVRTLHRAIRQMRATFDPSAFSAAWIGALASTVLPERLVFGLDGHFKPYTGDEPIDKGWDSKRRLATKGLADVFITDERGWTWAIAHVGAGDALSTHLLGEATRLRAQFGEARPIVLAFDRGGFAFEALDALDAEGFDYITYVPNTVKLPALESVAPATDGVGETAWNHEKLHHRARLLVERDGSALVPIATNLTTFVDAQDTVRLLRGCRGAQENAFKAARSHAHIDRLVDRGGATRSPDDRPIDNPARATLKLEVAVLRQREADLANEHATAGGRTRKEINRDRFRTGATRQLTEIDLRATPARVPRVTLEPNAERAKLDTETRLLLQPMKLATENARRWLLATLHDGLVPTDANYDADTAARTLDALLRAPGTVRFDDDAVYVTLDLPLPPTAHARLDAALRALTDRQFLFTDARRRLVVRLAPRPTRTALPHRVSSAN